jgi:serine phosphatase RsbU (regulator of sigma subunit)
MHPVAMLQSVNKELLDLGVDKFATMVVGLLDIQKNTLRYSIAGHLPLPVLVGESGARYLEGEGSTVGIMEDAIYEESEIALPEAFLLGVFSDGILEILPPKNLIAKEEYFLGVFAQTGQSPERLVAHLGLDHVETAPDDIAALFIRKSA